MVRRRRWAVSICDSTGLAVTPEEQRGDLTPVQWWMAYCASQLEDGEDLVEASTRLMVQSAWGRSDRNRAAMMRLLHASPSPTRSLRMLRRWVPGVVSYQRRRGPYRRK